MNKVILRSTDRESMLLLDLKDWFITGLTFYKICSTEEKIIMEEEIIMRE